MSFSSIEELKEHIKRNNRPIDDHFPPDEMLYRRVKKDEIVDGQVEYSVLKVPVFCANRSKYSLPEHVILFPFQDWGVIAFEIQYIPSGPYNTDEKTSYTFNVVHVPEEENYSHTEVRACKNGEYSARTKVPDSVKHKWRLKLREYIKVIIEPAKSVE